MEQLILNKEELEEVIATLAHAGGNRHLSSALAKIKNQMVVRFGEIAAEPVVRLEELEIEFGACDEIFDQDVSEVHVVAFVDGHFQCPEVELSIFGAGGPEAEEFPMVNLTVDGWLIAPEGLIEAGLPVPLERVLALFDEGSLKVFADRGVPIRWNPGWDGEATIDPARPDPDLVLRLVTR